MADLQAIKENISDVVAEHEGRALPADEVGSEHEGLGQAVGDLLNRVGQADAQLGAVAEQPVKTSGAQ